MRTKSVDISKWADGNGHPYDKPVVLKSLTFGDRRKIEDEVLKESGMRIVGDQMHGTFRTGLLKLLLLEKSIKEAPFPATREGIDSLDDEIAQILLKEIDELNGPLVKETKDS